MIAARQKKPLGVLVIASLGEAAPAQAQSVADFYRGKTLTLLVGVGVDGEFDLVTRLLAKYIGRHIPGDPSTVTQNVVRASGMKVLYYLYNQAPRDGTNIVLVQPALPAAQPLGLPGVQYDAGKLRWLGTIAPSVETMVVWHTTSVKTIKDASEREIVIGATVRGSNTYGFPALMKEFLGARFKIVTGYARGTQINLGVDRVAHSRASRPGPALHRKPPASGHPTTGRGCTLRASRSRHSAQSRAEPRLPGCSHLSCAAERTT